MDRAAWLLGVVALAGSVHGWSCKREVAARPTEPASEAAPGWPAPDARVRAEWPDFPESFGVRRVMIDPGHGAPGNKGNISCLCQDEEVFTLSASVALRERLEDTGHFEVRLTREGESRVDYRERAEQAEVWDAEAFVSVHSDVRDRVEQVAPGSNGCPTSVSAPGFSVLYADTGELGLVASRAALARALASRLHGAGLLPYGGASYRVDYEPDGSSTDGVFVDRHLPEQRIFVLHRVSMPSILVETHHALDPREVARWKDDETLDAFAAALASALVEVLR